MENKEKANRGIKDKLHSNRVMELLKEQEMTQQELADITGVGRTHITKIIQGKRRCISLPIAFKIARALNKPIEEVFIYKDRIVNK